MATIYTEADSNTRKTWFLLTGFLVLIIALGWLFSYLLNDSIILYFAVFLSIFMSFGSYWWSDKIVLGMYRAIPIEATGINVVATLDKMGMFIKFPVIKIFYRVGIILWD